MLNEDVFGNDEFYLAKHKRMKRLFLCAGLALATTVLSNCAQHDPTSPATSGGVPKDQPGAGIDTSDATLQSNTGGAPNSSNDGTNNNQQINTGDTGTKQQ
jgi:hypothetical protein